jgi:hypothetical protein
MIIINDGGFIKICASAPSQIRVQAVIIMT